jgi:hypothetical protein
MSEEVVMWQRIIASSGGEVETVYGPRVTHVLCETQKSAIFHRVICDISLCLAVILSNIWYVVYQTAVDNRPAQLREQSGHITPKVAWVDFGEWGSDTSLTVFLLHEISNV